MEFVAFILLLASAKISFEPQVEQMTNGGYTVTIFYRKNNVQSMSSSMIKMAQIAQKTCKGRGKPAMPGPLKVDEVPDQPKIGKMSEPFTCSQDN